MNIQELKWHINFLNLARSVAGWSKDPSKKIGAIAVSKEKRRVLSTGYNGLPRGIDDSPHRYQDRATKLKYIVHAEMNCIYNASYTGISLEDSTLYVWGLPVCSECAKGVIQVGVKEVYWDTHYDIDDYWLESMKVTKEMFNEVNIIFERLNINL